MNKTSIEWTDSTWNPIRGCSRVSEGCRNCYAERMATRFTKPGLAYEGLAVFQNGHPHWTGKIQFVEKHLLDPLRWGPVFEGIANGTGTLKRKEHRDGTVTVTRERPRRIFVNSMSDLFHENVTDEMRDRIFAVMALRPQHTFQVLTKRPARMLEYFANDMHGMRWLDAWDKLPNVPKSARASVTEVIDGKLPNVQLGVSVENQATADERIPLLLQTPAAARFISAEPLLGPIDLSILPRPFKFHQSPYGWERWLARHLHWAIVGGESGPGARQMNAAWARSLRDQCVAAGIPYFFKQWGAWVPTSDPKIAAARGIPLEECMTYVGKKAAGALLDGVEHRQFPEVRQ